MIVTRARSFWYFLLALFEESRRDTVLIRASGLAYASLLAAVPLVAVLFALFSAFGAFDDLKVKVQEFLVAQFLPTRQEEIVEYLNQFTDNVSQLGFIGFVFLIVTSVLLLDSIETNFNDIWHARNRRSYVSKLTAFTSVLVFGTVFLGASLSLSARIKAALFTGSILDRSFVNWLFGWSIPLLLTLIGFLLLYLIVPNASVRLKSALIGALVGGVFWELAKNIIATWVGRSVRVSTLYGSLATIPIFLIWLYITWLIVLVGLEVAHTHQHFRILEKQLARRRRPAEHPVSLALKVFTMAAQRFRLGQPPPTIEELAERFVEPLKQVETCTDRLVEIGMARWADAGKSLEGLVPATSLDKLRVSDLFVAFIGSEADAETGSGDVERAVSGLIEEFRVAGESRIGDRSFQAIVSDLNRAPAG